VQRYLHGAQTPASFPRTARVLTGAEFARIFKGARRTATPQLALHVLSDDGPTRLGLAVSRKVDKRAVGRNRIKRVVRDYFRLARAQLKPGAYVVVARAPAAQTDNAGLREVLSALFARAEAMQPVTDHSPTPPLSLPPGGGISIS